VIHWQLTRLADSTPLGLGFGVQGSGVFCCSVAHAVAGGVAQLSVVVSLHPWCNLY
jgi:hypothetical protein